MTDKRAIILENCFDPDEPDEKGLWLLWEDSPPTILQDLVAVHEWAWAYKSLCDEETAGELDRVGKWLGAQ